MLSGASLTVCAGRSGSQSQWLAGGRRDQTAIVAARPVPGMQRISAMVKGVHAVELVPDGKRPVTERRGPGVPVPVAQPQRCAISGWQLTSAAPMRSRRLASTAAPG